MNFLIILALLVCVIALVITLVLTKAEDTNYSSEKSMLNLSGIYLILAPLIIIVVGVVWLIL